MIDYSPTVNAAVTRSGVVVLAIASLITLFAYMPVKELHGTSVFYASLARELVSNRDPLFVFTGPEAYLLKPPLLIWMSALSMQVLGFTSAAATLAPRVGSLLVIILTVSLVKRVFDARVAVLAGFILVTNGTFIQFSTTLRMESWLLAGILLALLGWLRRDTSMGSAQLFGGIAVAVLAKGPIGLLAIALMGLHWLVVPATRGLSVNLRWVSMLLIPIGWYVYLSILHGINGAFSPAGDFMRATVNPELSFWQSAWVEYGSKPLRRYWPWLPFIIAGLLLPGWRWYQGEMSQSQSRLELWLVLWIAIVVVGSVVKPDQDIRYLYPALPAVAALGGLTLAAFSDLAKGWPIGLLGAGLLVGMLWLVVVFEYRDWRPGLQALQSTVEQYRDDYDRPLVIDGYPIVPGSPRRQNTHRDWIYYYLGLEPQIIPIGASAEQTRVDVPYVLIARSHGYQARLQEFGFKPLHVTKAMVLGVPQG